jgi:diguanylate cyclase (GGDEF)-like protein/PAS domain S-box-containing protein
VITKLLRLGSTKTALSGAWEPERRRGLGRIRNLSFGTQIAAVVVLSVLVTGAVLTVTFERTLHQEAIGDRTELVARAARDLAQQYEAAVDEDGEVAGVQALRSELDDVMEVIRAKEIVVTAADGLIIAHSDSGLTGKPDHEFVKKEEVIRSGRSYATEETEDGGEIFDVVVPIDLSGYGRVALEAETDMASIGAAMADTRSKILIPALVVLGLALLTATYVTWRFAKSVSATLQERESRFRALVQSSFDAVVVFAGSGAITFASPAVERMTGLAPDAQVGTDVLSRVHPKDVSIVSARLAELLRTADAVGFVFPEFRVEHRDRSWRWVEATGTNLLHEPAIRGIVINYRDVTERKALEDELTHRALHDGLTRLANRALFLDRVEQALAQARRFGQFPSVLFVDLDDFKDVNDGLGHDAGDRLLVTVSERLESSVRAADTVARLGGDEFAVLLDSGDGELDAVAAVKRIQSALGQPFSVSGREMIPRASIGVAGASKDDEADGLIRNADIAMYRAKAAGGNRFAVFEPRMHEEMVEQMRLRGDLEGALANREFALHYQPLTDLSTGRTIGFEALLRWQHKEKGLIPPAIFIPIAEESGLIVDIGRWVLREACAQAKRWQVHGPLAVGVNLSGKQLGLPTLVDDVTAALADSGLEAGLLTLEITESVLMVDADSAIQRLTELKRLGVRLAIDDFGTGFSSLAYLKDFPVDAVKIDKVFIDEVAHEGERTKMTRGILDLCRLLGLRTVAEGIESLPQLDRLKALHCDLGQGYLLARPLPALEAELFLVDEGFTRGPAGDGERAVS